MNSLSNGDVGTVNKDDAGITLIRRAEVIKTPSGEGDVWGFRDLDTGAEVFTCERFTFYRTKQEPRHDALVDGESASA